MNGQEASKYWICSDTGLERKQSGGAESKSPKGQLQSWDKMKGLAAYRPIDTEAKFKKKRKTAVGLLCTSYVFFVSDVLGNSELAESCMSDRTGEDICHCGWHSLKRPTHTIPYNLALQISQTGQMRNEPLRDILAFRGRREGDGRETGGLHSLFAGRWLLVS